MVIEIEHKDAARHELNISKQLLGTEVTESMGSVRAGTERVGRHRTYGFELFEEPRASLNVRSLQALREIYGEAERRAKQKKQ